MVHDCIEHAHEIGGVVPAAECYSTTVLNARSHPVLGEQMPVASLGRGPKLQVLQRAPRSGSILDPHRRVVLRLRQVVPVDRHGALQNAFYRAVLEFESAIAAWIHVEYVLSTSLELNAIVL